MTAAGKITTARLVPGSRILVRATLAEARGARVLTSANRPGRPGNLVATVTEVRVLAGPGRRRTIVTDVGVLDSTAAASHWPASAEDEAAVDGIVAAVRDGLGA
jgi:hypothetical protein